MYVSVGQDTVIRSRDIVTVCDIDRTSVSSITRDFLKRAQEENRVLVAAGDIPVSFILCVDGTVILSPLNTLTIKRRMTEKFIA